MRSGLIAALVVSLGVAGAWAKGGAAKETAPAGLWKTLVKAGAKWTLEAEGEAGQPPNRLLVETYDARKVGDADVARLRYVRVDKGKKEDVTSGVGSMPSQVAVNPKGIWLLDKGDDDARVAEALKKPPAHADPPRLLDGMKRKDGKLVRLHHTGKGDVVCIGYVPGKGARDCDDVCFGDFCVSPSLGLVVIEGTYAPGQAMYVQPGFSL